MKTSRALLAAALWALPAVCVAAPGSPTPLQVLQRVLAAEERVPFSARQTVVLGYGGRAEAAVTDEVNYGFSRSRVASVMPQSAHGRVVIRDGRHRWTIDPATKTVIKSEVVHRAVEPARARKIALQVARSYKLSLDQNASFVSGRPVDVLSLTPKRADRQRRLWWVDRKTGLILKREVYRTDGTLEQTTSYSNVDFNVKFNPAAVRVSVPSGFRLVSRPPDRLVTSLSAARKLGPECRNIPPELDGGFVFESARIVDAQGSRAVHVEYSDGLAGLSLFKMPAPTHIVSSTGGRSRTVSVGSSTGTIVDTVAPYRVLTWQAAGATFNLVSDIADETMIRLASTLRF